MPWSKDDLPDAVKGKDWTEAQISVFVSTANAVLRKTGDEGEAIATGIKQVEGGAKRNAKQIPKVYIARHMAPGLCGYEDETVMLDADAIKGMMPSFEGKPVYVEHQDPLTPERLRKLKELASGYVTRSFYNDLDGEFYVEFIVIDDEAHEAINALGWAVSNAYTPTAWEGPGEHHNLPYTRKITAGEYDHLALVPNPRYENAQIFTPAEFKAYNEAKAAALKQLSNSKPPKQEKHPMLKFFFNKREEISADQITAENIGEAVVLVNGKEVRVSDMVAALEKKTAPTLRVNGKDMTLEEVTAQFAALKNAGEGGVEPDPKKAAKKAAKKNEDEADEDAREKKENRRKNADDDADGWDDEDEKKNADDEDDMENADGCEDDGFALEKKGSEAAARNAKKNSKSRADLEDANFAALMNAAPRSSRENSVTLDTPRMQDTRGAARYGK